MTTSIEVNVMGFDTKDPTPSKPYFTGDFIFQQITPTPNIIVDEAGNVNLLNVSGPVEILFRWLSPQVAVDGLLYPASYWPIPNENFWVLQGTNKPKKNNPPTGGDPFTVSLVSPNELKVIDDNNDGKFYTYCLAVRLGIDGGSDFVADPKITNKDVNRIAPLDKDCY